VTSHIRIYAAAYFAAQGLAGAGWWIVMETEPALAGYFLSKQIGEAQYGALLISDVMIFVLGSLVASGAIWMKARWHMLSVWGVTGGTAYATIFALAMYVLAGEGAVGAVLMVGATACCFLFGWRLWRAGP